MSILKGLFVLFLILFALFIASVLPLLFSRQFWRRSDAIIHAIFILYESAVFGLGVYATIFDWSLIGYFFLGLCGFVPIFFTLMVLDARKEGVSWKDVKQAVGKGVAKLELAKFNRGNALEKAEARLLKDPRPPVLYLRSFARESRAYNLRFGFFMASQKFKNIFRLGAAALKDIYNNTLENGEAISAMREMMRGRNVYGTLTAQNIFESWKSGRNLFDEQFLIANIMNRIGPYIAIARPNERKGWRDIGAAKLAANDDRWQIVVAELIAKASAIVVEAGDSEGLVWELHQLVQLASPIRILLILPITQKEYDTFKQSVAHILPTTLPNKRPLSRLMTFRANWEPIELYDEWNSLEDDVVGRHFENSLRIFLEQNGFPALIHDPTQRRTNGVAK